MNIRKQVSKILGYTILTDEKGAKWDEAFQTLQVEGRVTSKHTLQIIILLLKREESRESQTDSSSELNELESSVTSLLKAKENIENQGERLKELAERIKKLETKKDKKPVFVANKVKDAPKSTKKRKSA